MNHLKGFRVVQLRGVSPNRDFTEVAVLHSTGLDHGFLSTLGPRFLALLYRSMSDTPGCWVFAAKDDSHVFGFAAATLSTGQVYRRFVLKHTLGAGVAALPHLLSASCLQRLAETVRYARADCSLRERREATGIAELLSIAVADEYRGTGMAARLYREIALQCSIAGASALKIVVGQELVRARGFYEKMGAFEVARISVHRGTESIVMEHRLDRVKRDSGRMTGESALAK